MPNQQYPYDISGDYIFDAGKIEIANGIARLKDLGGEVYADDQPAIQPVAVLNPFGVDDWSGFSEILGAGNQGSVEYQLSKDGGLEWYYWDGAIWAAAVTQHNPASVIAAHIAGFDVNPNRITFRAFLISDGLQPVELDSNEIAYDLMAEFPGILPDYDYEESITYEGVKITQYPNGREQRISTVTSPRRQFNLKFGVLSSSDMDLLWNFYLQQAGQLKPFIFTSPRNGQQFIARFVNKIMSRTLFAYLLESTGVSLIEVIN
ncbi:MAG: DUF2460 domain-containing protein [Candidatus Schekmanbacteria bacterium]|nr:DUF2460 domain-containing protein [Candidatus Schekmanbacteria bacterium]